MTQKLVKIQITQVFESDLIFNLRLKSHELSFNFEINVKNYRFFNQI